MEDKVSKAILAMDSYNRGYNPALDIGTYFDLTSSGVAGIAIGTFARLWQLQAGDFLSEILPQAPQNAG